MMCWFEVTADSFANVNSPKGTSLPFQNYKCRPIMRKVERNHIQI